MKTYPMHENRVPTWLKDALGGSKLSTAEMQKALWSVRFVRTGEYRNPLKGEFYLSGADPGAWAAYNDMSSPYHILRPVRVKTVTTETVEPL